MAKDFSDYGPKSEPEDPYFEMEEQLLELIEGYTLHEVLERLSVVVRHLPNGPDTSCPSGTVFSEASYHQHIAKTLAGLAA